MVASYEIGTPSHGSPNDIMDNEYKFDLRTLKYSFSLFFEWISGISDLNLGLHELGWSYEDCCVILYQVDGADDVPSASWTGPNRFCMDFPHWHELIHLCHCW